MKKVALYTLGCRVNQYETEAMAETFIKKGYEAVDFEDYADVYVINTCTVTNMGDRKSRQMIRKAKRKNPDSVIAVAGCYAQVSPDEAAAIEGVDVVVGTSDKGRIADLVEEYEKNKKKIKMVENIMNVREFEELQIDEYQDRTRAFLKIQDGCDRYCSYCLIPFARGPVRSRKPENIINEVVKLADKGFKEVILSGIHVASYGKDIGDVTLLDVIKGINEIDGIERIRIGSVDPTFFTEKVIKEIAKIEKLCPHFHLSLQSGCNETLKRMNRHYTSEEYKSTVEGLRQAFPDVSITTDVIVGFPGETDEEFKSTYEFLKDIRLSKMHIFKYSPRKGTRAAQYKEQVPPEVKEQRSKILLELDSELERIFIEKFVSRKMDVLFEEMNGEISNGYTKNYIKVSVNSEDDISGKIYDVNLTECVGNYAKGYIIR